MKKLLMVISAMALAGIVAFSAPQADVPKTNDTGVTQVADAATATASPQLDPGGSL